MKATELQHLTNGQRVTIIRHRLQPNYLHGEIEAITHKGTTGGNVEYIYFSTVNIEKHGPLTINMHEVIEVR